MIMFLASTSLNLFTASFVLLSFSVCCSNCSPISPIESILQSLTRMLEFYEATIEEVNVDAIFGIQVVKGALSSIVTADLASSYTSRIKDLHRLSSEIADNGVRELLNKHDPSLNLLYQLIALEFPSSPYKRLKVNTTLIWPTVETFSNSERTFGEKKSDDCFGEVLRTIQEGKCSIADSCADAISTPHLSGYAMLHQLLFNQLVSRPGNLCADLWQELLAKRNITNYRVFEQHWCANSLNQMKQLLQKTNTGNVVIQGPDQDLFFEHLFVCPSSGFEEFLKLEYLDVIIQTQHSSGCWKDETSDAVVRRRKLLTEKKLSDGCLFHKTAVAVGALSQYLQLYVFQSHQVRQPLSLRLPTTPGATNYYYIMVCIILLAATACLVCRKRKHFLCV